MKPSMKPSIKPIEQTQFIDWLLPEAKKDNVQFDYGLVVGEYSSIQFRKDILKNCSSSQSQNFMLRLLKGDKQGTSYTKNFQKEHVKACYRQALDSLQLSDHQKKGISSSYYQADKHSTTSCKTSVFPPSPISILSQTDKLKKAQSLNQSVLSFNKKVQPDYIEVADETCQVYYGNDQYHLQSYQHYDVSAFCMSLAIDKNNRSQGVSQQTAQKYEDIDFQQLGKLSAKKALKKLSYTIPPTGKYPVIFSSDPDSASTLVSLLLKHFNGKTIYEKLSLLEQKINQALFAKNFTLTDDPFASWGKQTTPFDAEGFPSQKTTLVKQGVVKNYLTSSIFAKALNAPHTAKAMWIESPSSAQIGIAPTNIVMHEGEYALNDLLKEFSKGVLIDNLKGLAGYNATSGDFSIESEGFLWTEYGQNLQALCQFTVSGNIIDVFSHILKIANDSQIQGGCIKAPSFLVPELSIAGK